MPDDEFELLLERCRENLSEISLRVPNLEIGPPRHLPIVYTLTSPAAPPPKPAAPPPKVPEPQAPPRIEAHDPPPVREKAPEPRAAAPVPEEREEEEVFPPLVVRPRTPPPAVPLWSVTPVSVPATEPASDSESAPGARRRAGAAAAAAAVAAGFAVWAVRRPAPDLDIQVDAADAMAVRLGKGDLLVAKDKELLDLSWKGQVLERRPLEAPVEALRWEQGSLWSADGRTASVVEHADNGRTTVFRLNHVPDALYVKDNALWTAEKGGHVLHQFLISRSILGALLQPLDSFELNGLSPETFTLDDAGALWLVDEPTRRLYRLHLENGSYKPSSSAPLSPFFGPQGTLRSLSVEGNAVWILSQPDAGRASLRRIAISRFDWTTPLVGDPAGPGSSAAPRRPSHWSFPVCIISACTRWKARWAGT